MCIVHRLLFTKTYRIYRIFQSLSVIDLPDGKLFWMWMGMIGADLVILFLWTILDPLTPTTTFSKTIEYQYTITCDSKNSTSFLTALGVYKVCYRMTSHVTLMLTCQIMNEWRFSNRGCWLLLV
jgi:hypothetical protein